MNSPKPEDLPEEIRSVVTPLLESARKKGWKVGMPHWNDQAGRVVSINGNRPSGDHFHIISTEANLVVNLKALFFTSENSN